MKDLDRKYMWEKGGSFTLLCISLIFLNSCQEFANEIEIRNNHTFLKFPSYSTFCSIDEPEIANVVTFNITISNHSDSSLLLQGNSFLDKKRSKSNFYLIHNKLLTELTFMDREVILGSGQTENLIQLSLDIPNEYHVNCIDEELYSILKDSIYSISQDGDLIYIPNKFEYEKFSKAGFKIIDNPIVISRKGTVYYEKQYLPSGQEVYFD